MGDEEPVGVGQREIIDAGPHLRDHAFIAALQIDAQDLAAAALSRKQETLAVELDRGGDGEIGGKYFGLAAFEGNAPDLVGANRREVDVAVGTDR